MQDDFHALSLPLHAHAEHIIYIKPHRTRQADPSLPADRTLFIVNLPPLMDVSKLQSLLAEGLSSCGPVVDVRVVNTSSTSQLKPSRTRLGCFAFVVFSEPPQLHRFIRGEKMKMKSPLAATMAARRSPLQRWVTDRRAYETELDADLKQFADQSEQPPTLVAEEDGWIRVQRGVNRRHTVRGSEVTVKSIAPRTQRRLQKGAETMEDKYKQLDFYRFQQRQVKRDRLAELRKQFELDQHRLSELKARRQRRHVL